MNFINVSSLVVGSLCICFLALEYDNMITSSPVNVHVLRAVPLGVVSITITNLSNELMVRLVTPDEVVCAPSEGLGVSLGQPGGLISLL